VRRNIELKAKDRHPERSLEVCQSLDVEAKGILSQRDTYFGARSGRLKLREEDGAAAHLIAYERSDLAGQRESRYRIVAVEEAEQMRAALAGALGVRTEIVKERRLFIWQGVRIHLDRVDGLGHFIELEAVIGSTDSDLLAGEKIATLRRALGIEDLDLLGSSYCDLALADREG
jgi:adenylate cyclase, class 2